jgi:glycosyltransferase involved in cell wall biosynthesis
MEPTIIIPAYNEERTIADVIRRVKARYPRVLVVDDGSTDGTARLAEAEGVRVYRHVINRGLGGALGTGIAAALREGAEILVTFDADGQHDAEEIERLIAPIREGKADVVIGSRMLRPEGMPLVRRVANRIGNAVTWLLFGIRVSDSQSGFRAFSRDAASRLRLRSNRMEVSSELIHEAKRHRFRFAEIAIRPIYTEYSLSKGQGFVTGLKTLLRLIVLRSSK